MLVHNVFFYLKPELTEAQKADFFRGIATLKSVPGVEKVYIGTPAAVADRPTLDKSYGAGLTCIFKDVAAHNAYQVNPIHKSFIESCKQYWGRVQVYDAQEIA